ncbi:hypothetical protein GC096_30500 [Paenibacillus sp. LMG 31461]|uniref:Replicative helicase inhibitor G39P N-terminal domain-containing protein n=1 Tax=Paenibacillus plantarum TaxID=2654975 RepID=A0ABX1XJW3_9BACL|nr:hypothetical protein [Paenibacillus plantarum]NOU68361.1 hypothetical protein [Paenibacillus plantarum]
MNKLEIAELFREIKLHYANFDAGADKREAWHKRLEQADKTAVMQNLDQHIKLREFPPTVAELLKTIDPYQGYHDNLKESAHELFTDLNQWRENSVAPPESLREKVRDLAIRRANRN